MRIYPAIDLYQGKVVRLTRGDFQKPIIYSEKPESIARDWEDQGAEWIHVVDLEGAKSGRPVNREALLKIRKAVKCKIQFGGGIRKIEDIASLLDEGMERVVLGTKALDKDFFSQALGQFREKIAVSLDVKEGMVQTQGWLESGREFLEEALKRLNDFPLETVIYTDIQKDGMLQGPNFAELSRLLEVSKSSLILSGGVGSLHHIERCRALSRDNFEGVIVGKALYEKKFSLRDALRIVKA